MSELDKFDVLLLTNKKYASNIRNDKYLLNWLTNRHSVVVSELDINSFNMDSITNTNFNIMINNCYPSYIGVNQQVLDHINNNNKTLIISMVGLDLDSLEIDAIRELNNQLNNRLTILTENTYYKYSLESSIENIDVSIFEYESVTDRDNNNNK